MNNVKSKLNDNILDMIVTESVEQITSRVWSIVSEKTYSPLWVQFKPNYNLIQYNKILQSKDYYK